MFNIYTSSPGEKPHATIPAWLPVLTLLFLLSFVGIMIWSVATYDSADYDAARVAPDGRQGSMPRNGHDWINGSDADRRAWAQKASKVTGVKSSDMQDSLDAFYGRK